MNTLINSITQVSDACENAQHINAESDDTVDEASIVNTINNISTSYEEFKKDYNTTVESKRGEILKAICKLSGITSKMIMPQDYHKRISQDGKISILKILGRTNNENLHSDFIACLFDPSVMGEFSNHLFKSMIVDYYHIEIDHNLFSFAKVDRERRLDSISDSLLAEEIGQRRIDVLVKTKGHFILIENKILSTESESQTETYYDIVSKAWKNKKGAYYFLSPSGMASNCNEFISITYMDIYKRMIELEEYVEKGDARQFFDMCMNEIAQCILKPILKGIDNANKYLKENNHEFK